MKMQLLPLSIVVMGAIFTFSCNHQPKESAHAGNADFISDSAMKLIRLDTARWRNIDDELKLSGEVSFDENKVVKIYPFSSGQVLSVNVSIGDYVKSGQTLATIKSAEVAGNYADLSIAGNDIAIAEKDMQNKDRLYKNGIASEKEYQEAREYYNKAMANAHKIKEQIQINGGGRTAASGVYIVTAPRSGYVVEKLINPGNFIRNDNSTNMFTIGDISDVWIWANVYETDIAKVKQGYAAFVNTLSYPDSVFEGKVDKVSQVLDPVSKVMKIRIVLANRSGTLKPEMFANITIHNTEASKMVAVPASAIINDNKKNYVVVFKNNNDVDSREIKVYKTAGGYAYIREGLQQGEQIITKNQILIYKKIQDNNNTSVGSR
ncbi:efflux RND transporter periplasmic adaptor subunit [Paraflavitalea soli]|uniref:Efflux RND transporter periplasmic adaptor subunit n=1 Tax=Paraflavitalea soli TaxID=2315862 RepID=A0A3B7MYR0_9BACT|nr:efflux RND transporter periplasmic adaptor subunit [Paraflavitalea soli]AXY78206.1 efflux RND transporter periplasmic adaptor subunit [Paraflavitalea soli]